MSRNTPRISKLASILLMSAHCLAIARTDLRAVETEGPVDPMTAAYGARTTLEASDHEFALQSKQLLEALDASIQRVPQRSWESDFSNEREALLLFIRVTEALIKECDEVLAAQQRYLEAGRRYASDLAQAGPTFSAAANLHREFASAEVYSDARQDYLLMADILDALAVRCQHLPSDLNPQVQAVEELYPYLQNGRQVLVRFRDVLQAIPVLQSFQEFDALDRRLKQYVNSYEKFRGSLHKLHKQLEASPTMELGSKIVSIGTKTSSFRHRSPPATNNLQLAVWQRNQFVTSRQSERFPGERPGASSFAEDNRELSPTRHILVYAKRESPFEYRYAGVRDDALVDVGQRFDIRTADGTICPVTVVDKFYWSDQSQTQYWSTQTHQFRH